MEKLLKILEMKKLNYKIINGEFEIELKSGIYHAHVLDKTSIDEIIDIIYYSEMTK